MAQPRVAEAEAKRSEEPVPVKEGPNVEEYLAVPATTTSYHLAEGRLATSPAPILDRKPVGAISRACDGLARASGGEAVVWAADCQLRACRKAGRREAWLVDPGSQTVIVFTGDGNSWREEQPVPFGDPVSSVPLLQASAGLERFA